MSRSQSGTDYGELFERVTGETEVREPQDTDANTGRTLEENVSDVVTEHARETGLEEALSEPDLE